MRPGAAISEAGRGGSGESPVPRRSAGGLATVRQVFHQRISTPRAFERLAAEASLPMVMRPLDSHPPELDLTGFTAPDLAIWTVTSPTGFESSPRDAPALYSVRIPLRGMVSRRTGKGSHETRAGSATILPAADILVSRFAPDSQILCCAVGAHDLLARHEALEGGSARPFHDRPTVEPDGLRLRALVHTIRQIEQHVGTGAEGLAGPLLRDLMLNQILSTWAPEDPARHHVPATGSLLRTTDRAIDYIEAHLGEALTIGEVAGAAGVGVRTLQSAFRARTGSTPLGYILERRLDRVHADLLANEGRLQVSQIAHRWGFLHMGEFARRYRLRFGCTPSQTNRRAP